MISKVLPDKVLKNLPEPHATIISLCASSGLRISDCLNITVKQAMKQQPYIKERKTGKTKRVFIGKKMQKRLTSLIKEHGLKDDDFVFAKGSGEKHITRQAVWSAVKKTAAAQTGCSRHISPHSARKRYTMKKFEAGMSLKQVKNKLNHDNLTTTLLYQHADEIAEEQDKELNKINKSRK